MKLAAIEGQLVSIKNVSTHKSACLTIHVPEEYALKVIEAFGWPTMVAPVHVAIARMGNGSAGDSGKASAEAPEANSSGAITSPDATKPKRKWDELSIAQQAGILCNEKGFQMFVGEQIAKMPGAHPIQDRIDVDDAAQYVRQQCGVNSRAHIEGKPDAERIFRDLRISYDNWLRAT